MSAERCIVSVLVIFCSSLFRLFLPSFRKLTRLSLRSWLSALSSQVRWGAIDTILFFAQSILLHPRSLMFYPVDSVSPSRLRLRTRSVDESSKKAAPLVNQGQRSKKNDIVTSSSKSTCSAAPLFLTAHTERSSVVSMEPSPHWPCKSSQLPVRRRGSVVPADCLVYMVFLFLVFL